MHNIICITYYTYCSYLNTWGVGHFRPAVIIPALFALISSPLTADFGAALGTQLGIFILPTGLGPIGSLVSGVPVNFLGFIIYGFIVHKRRSWTRFIIGTVVGTLVGNFIAASGVAFWLTVIAPKWVKMSSEALLLIIFGLTMYWEVTMVPFILIIVPPTLVALRVLGNRVLYLI